MGAGKRREKLPAQTLFSRNESNLRVSQIFFALWAGSAYGTIASSTISTI
jgi:hypothetical protein